MQGTRDGRVTVFHFSIVFFLPVLWNDDIVKKINEREGGK